MKNEITPTKYMVYGTIKKEFGIILTDEQLNTIDDIYISERKSNVFTVGLYRFINMLWSGIFMFIFWLFSGTKFNQYLFVILMMIFFLYNMIHLWNNIMDYKTIKKNKVENE